MISDWDCRLKKIRLWTKNNLEKDQALQLLIKFSEVKDVRLWLSIDFTNSSMQEMLSWKIMPLNIIVFDSKSKRSCDDPIFFMYSGDSLKLIWNQRLFTFKLDESNNSTSCLGFFNLNFEYNGDWEDIMILTTGSLNLTMTLVSIEKDDDDFEPFIPYIESLDEWSSIILDKNYLTLRTTFDKALDIIDRRRIFF